MSTKLQATCAALGNPTSFHLTPGQASDLAGADALLPELVKHVQTLLADTAYDAQERVLAVLEKAEVTIVIPPKANRCQPRPSDKHLYQARHLSENFFAQLKQYRALATRYDKRAGSFLGAIYLAASVILLN